VGLLVCPLMAQLTGIDFTNARAEVHPSQPNYIALFSGQTNDNGDGCPATGVNRSGPNLGSELLEAHLSFAGYSETMPSAGFGGCFYGRDPFAYARKHNPWVNFTNVPSSDNRTFAELRDYAALPTVAVSIPNEAHYMHSASIADGDKWLRQNIDPLLRWGQAHNTLLVLTWDEGPNFLNNHIPTIFYGPMVQPGSYNELINHYTVLRTIEELYRLPHAGRSDSTIPITDCWIKKSNAKRTL